MSRQVSVDETTAEVVLAKRRHRSSIIFARWQHASRSLSWRVHLGPHFGGLGSRRGSTMVSFERAMVVSYGLSILTACYL